jgi:hypothetical protein
MSGGSGSFSMTEIIFTGLVLIWVVFRQMRPRPLRTRSLVIPGVITVIGLLAIAHAAKKGHLTAPDMEWLGIDLGIGVVTGTARALTVRLYQSNGRVWRQGRPLTIVLWVVTVGVKIGLGALAGRSAAGTTVIDLLMTLGVTLAVQQTVLLLRARVARRARRVNRMNPEGVY